VAVATPYALLKKSDGSSSSATSTSLWSVSTVPLGDVVTTPEDHPIMIHINVSDSIYGSISNNIGNINNDVTISIESTPEHGSLYVITEDKVPSYASNTRISFVDYTKYGTLLLPSNVFKPSSILVYVPVSDYHGNDHFNIQATTSDSRTSSMTTISLIISPTLDLHQLKLDDAEIKLDSFRLIDKDSWENNYKTRVSLDVSQSMPSDVPEHAKAKLSLSSTRGLDFSSLSSYGDGINDTSMSFTSNIDAASDAVSELTINLEDKMVTKTQIDVKLEVNDSSIGDVSSSSLYEVPMSMRFSSLPRITDISPTVVTTTGESTIDLYSKLFASDVTFCSIDNVLSPLQRLSNEVVRCNLPILTKGTHNIKVLTGAGIFKCYSISGIGTDHN
jgi:hypothetical protein